MQSGFFVPALGSLIPETPMMKYLKQYKYDNGYHFKIWLIRRVLKFRKYIDVDYHLGIRAWKTRNWNAV